MQLNWTIKSNTADELIDLMRLTLNFETVLQRGDSMGFKWGLNGD